MQRRREERRSRGAAIRDGERPSPVGREFCRRLVNARLAAGLTQAELAARIGTTQSAIARLERGGTVPTVETLYRLAGELGLRFEINPKEGLVVPPGEYPPTLEDLRARRDEILGITSKHGARDVRVFGSVARGEARKSSDIDLLVEFEPGRTVLDLSGLILNLQDALGRKVDVVEVKPTSPTAERIEREAVPL